MQDCQQFQYTNTWRRQFEIIKVVKIKPSTGHLNEVGINKKHFNRNLL